MLISIRAGNMKIFFIPNYFRIENAFTSIKIVSLQRGADDFKQPGT